MATVNRWSPFVVAGLLALATAAAVPATRPTPPAPRRANPAAEPRPITVEPNKPFEHAASGFVFPYNVGAFRRATAHAFDEAGANVSVGYADPSLKIVLTVYVYPHLGLGADAHFRQVKADVTRANPKAELLDEGKATATGPGGRQHDGLRARYGFVGRFAGVEQDLVSEAYLFAHGPNFVKYRLTYPAADAKAAALRVEFFLKTLAFPEVPATKPAK